MPPDKSVVKLPSRGGRWLAAIVTAICVGSEVIYLTSNEVADGLRIAPVFAFVIVVFWVAFWTPTIVLASTGITVVNPFRTFEVAWPSLKSVETRWVLTLFTSGPRIAVWAAPRQRRGAMGIEVRRDSYGLPSFEAEQQFERQSAPVATGDVADYLISRRLTERAENGQADASETVAPPVEIRTHFVSIAVLILLAAASVAAIATQ